MAANVLIRNLSETLRMDEKIILLFLSLFLSYPLAFFYRSFVYRFSPTIHHLFFTITGLLIYYMNFGEAVTHSILNIFVIYLVLAFTAGSLFSVIFSFIFNTAYLVFAYWVIKNDVVDTYEITWTIPHCVLTLRLTAVVWDMYDNSRPRSDLSQDELACVLSKRPSILEMFGCCSVLCTFLIGPQFSMKRYLDLTQGKYCDRTSGGPPHNVAAGITRLCMGLGCCAIYQLFTPFFPQSYFTENFLTDPFWYQCFFLAMWGKVVLYRYVGVWIIAEGSIILLGLTHNGQDNNGNDMWDGCANVDVKRYETCQSLRGVIESFNVNTNKWMAQYIYKRLKFVGSKPVSHISTLSYLALWHGLYSGYYHTYIYKRLKFVGSKPVSHISTLSYLALWHGLYSGYYHTFALEFVTMSVENKFIPMMSNSRLNRWIDSTILWIPSYIVRKSLLQLCVGYCLLSFCLLKNIIYCKVYYSMYWFGHVLFALSWVLSLFLRNPRSPRPQQSHAD